MRIIEGELDVKEVIGESLVVTKDHELSAQWEHTVLVTNTGFEVLTRSEGTPLPPDGLSFKV